MSEPEDAGEEQPAYYYYLDFQGRGSLWATGRHHMRVVEGGTYKRDKRTTSSVITETVHVSELDPETGRVKYTVSEPHANTRMASGVAEGMGQIRARSTTPTAHLETEPIPEGLTPHNRIRGGWPSRPMDSEDIPEDSAPEPMTDGGSDNLVEVKGAELLDVEPAPDDAGECGLMCEDGPEYRVKLGSGGATTTVDACQSCLNRCRLYPQDHEPMTDGGVEVSGTYVCSDCGIRTFPIATSRGHALACGCTDESGGMTVTFGDDETEFPDAWEHDGTALETVLAGGGD